MIPGLPDNLQNIGDHLVAYGYRLEQLSTGWMVYYPARHAQASRPETILTANLGLRLLSILRSHEVELGNVRRYEQFNSRWAELTYGHNRRDTNMRQAGCGPTTLAIVLNYLMHDPLVQARPRAITPLETMEYAASHGRVSGNGTDGNRMIQDLHQQWPQFDGRAVVFNEAARLVASGHLIIFLSRGCRGYRRGAPLSGPPIDPYDGNGHFMVMAGIDRAGENGRLFYILDPGGNCNTGIRYMWESELQRHCLGFWWVFAASPQSSATA